MIPLLVCRAGQVMVHLGYCLRRAGLLAQAQYVLDQAHARVSLKPSYQWALYDTYRQMGLLAVQQANPQLALLHLNKAVSPSLIPPP